MVATIAVAMVPIILKPNHPKSEHKNILILNGFWIQMLGYSSPHCTCLQMCTPASETFKGTIINDVTQREGGRVGYFLITQHTAQGISARQMWKMVKNCQNLPDVIYESSWRNLVYQKNIFYLRLIIFCLAADVFFLEIVELKIGNIFFRSIAWCLQINQGKLSSLYLQINQGIVVVLKK